MKELPIAGKDVFCSCNTCKGMCMRPCWPTPAEAQKLIKAGHGARLMMDWWEGGGPNGSNIEILAPASSGYEGGTAPYSANSSACNFQNAEGLCELHDSGLKPVEGRFASCKPGVTPPGLHKEVAMSWNNEMAQAAVTAWRKSCS